MYPFSEAEILSALQKRHTIALQEKLSHGHVAIAGLGGLGSNVAFALARLGVGFLHLIDFDRVDLTNLNRQQYFLSHVGMYKTDALQQQLLQINPYLHIQTSCVRVDAQNIKTLFAQADIICEAFDDPEAKALLVNGILENFPEKKLVCASGMAGYGSSNAIHTRRIAKNFYLCGDETTEITENQCLMAPRAALCAAHQANMITHLLLGEEDVSSENEKSEK